MTVEPCFESGAFEAIHSSASALHRVGAIDKATMWNFDKASLSLLDPEEHTTFVDAIGHPFMAGPKLRALLRRTPAWED